MKTIPSIGQRVRYSGAWGEMTGTVRAIYPSHKPVGGADDDDDYDGPYEQEPFRPDRWKASVEVDELPPNWPYGQNRKFCPVIEDLEPL